MTVISQRENNKENTLKIKTKEDKTKEDKGKDKDKEKGRKPGKNLFRECTG